MLFPPNSRGVSATARNDNGRGGGEREVPPQKNAFDLTVDRRSIRVETAKSAQNFLLSRDNAPSSSLEWLYLLRSAKRCAVHNAQSGPLTGAKNLCAVAALPAAQPDHLIIVLYHNVSYHTFQKH
jgi:hypothetical protein